MAIRNSLLRGLNIVLAAALGLLGFSRCTEPEVEYGVPNADYTVKGTVLDKVDSKPIKGIRIGFTRITSEPIMMYGVLPTPYRSIKADTTDVQGSYKLTDNLSIDKLEDDVLTVYVQDIDGTENGQYNDTTLNVDFKNVKASGKAKNWYAGEYSVDLNVKLTRKNEGDE